MSSAFSADSIPEDEVNLAIVRDVFLRVIEYPEAEQDAAAERMCGAMSHVLAEVRALLVRAPSGTAGLGISGRDDSASFVDASPPEAEERLPPLPGEGAKVLGRYVLGALLGSGGFGQVRMAEDRVTGETVAVKVVAGRADRSSLRHGRELAALRRARIPGVVELLDSGFDGENAVFVMAHVEGKAFPGVLTPGREAEEIASRTAALVSIVGRLHALGIHHRDLKPWNVLVDTEGRVTLVDLGVAHDASDHEARSRLGNGGTRRYMAPERLRGGASTLRSEIFSVGVMAIDAVLTNGAAARARSNTPSRASRSWAIQSRAGRSYGLATAQDLAAALANAQAPGLAELLPPLVSPRPEDRPDDLDVLVERLAAIGPQERAIRLPRLGDRAPLDAVLDAARQGRSLVVTGPHGSGRSRLLADAEEALVAEGRSVLRVRATDWSVAPTGFGGDASPEELDARICADIRRRVADGLVLLADDHDALDRPTIVFLAELRRIGSVVRVLDREPTPAGSSDEIRVGLAPLTEDDVRGIVRAPERIFGTRSAATALLLRRTRGLPGRLVREIREWCAFGFASWQDGLVVRPAGFARMNGTRRPLLPRPVPGGLSNDAREIHEVLVHVGASLSVAALAQVAGKLHRVVAAELPALIEAGLVEESGDGAFAPRTAPASPEATDEARRRWSERAAPLLPPGSGSAVRHLLAAGRWEEAGRRAVEVAAAGPAQGETVAALRVLDAALTAARSHVPENEALYAALVASLTEVAILDGSRSSADLALYHAGLAPGSNVSVLAWTEILQAIDASRKGNPERALTLLERYRDGPTPAHAFAAFRTAQFAARATRDDARHRRWLAAFGAFARRSGDARVRAAFRSASSWRFYDRARYGAARRRFERAADAPIPPYLRQTIRCNAAIAALDAGDGPGATRLARAVEECLRTIPSTTNAPRLEFVLRQCAYRFADDAAPDEDLLDAVRHVDADQTRATLQLTEAAIAWRAGRTDFAASLASAAAASFRLARFDMAAALTAALAAHCGASVDPALLAPVTAAATGGVPIGLFAQAAALLPEEFPLAEVPRQESIRWAERASGPDLRREVLSPNEVLNRLRHRGCPASNPKEPDLCSRP